MVRCVGPSSWCDASAIRSAIGGLIRHPGPIRRKRLQKLTGRRKWTEAIHPHVDRSTEIPEQNQLDAVRKYVAERGFELVRPYTDAGKSGPSIDCRKVLQQMIQDVMRWPMTNTSAVAPKSRWIIAPGSSKMMVDWLPPSSRAQSVQWPVSTVVRYRQGGAAGFGHDDGLVTFSGKCNALGTLYPMALCGLSFLSCLRQSSGFSPASARLMNQYAFRHSDLTLLLNVRRGQKTVREAVCPDAR